MKAANAIPTRCHQECSLQEPSKIVQGLLRPARWATAFGSLLALIVLVSIVVETQAFQEKFQEQSPPKPWPPSAEPKESPWADVPGRPPEQVFKSMCAACHGSKGTGSAMRGEMPKIPDFTDPNWQRSRFDAHLKHSILEGKGKFMRPMKSKLTPAEADALVAHVRKFAQPKP
jgi:mono/diheme cytochrome c family protein